MASASIFQQYLKPPKSITEYGAELDAGEANQLSLAEARRKGVASDQAMKEQNAFKAALAGGADLSTPEGFSSAMRVAPTLAIKTAGELEKVRGARAKTKLDDAKSEMELLNTGIKRMQDFRESIARLNTHEDIIADVQQKVTEGKITQQQAYQTVAGMPPPEAGKAAFDEWRRTMALNAEQRQKSFEQTRAYLETERSNKAKESEIQSRIDLRKSQGKAAESIAAGNAPASASVNIGGGISVPMPGGGAQQQAGPVASGAIPGNNYGNIRPVGGGPNSGFQTYDSPQAGMNAIIQNLQAYGQRGINTIERVISTWAPPTDKNDTPALIRRASQILGVSPNQPLDMNNPATLNALGTAIILQEHGPKAFVASKLGPGAMTAVSQDPAQKLSPEAMTAQAAPENIRATPAQSAAAFVRKEFPGSTPLPGETRNIFTARQAREKLQWDANQNALERDAIKQGNKTPSITVQKESLSQQKQFREIESVISELNQITKPGGLIDKSTGSGVGAIVDMAGRAVGKSTKGGVAIAQLKPIADMVLKLVPRFEGPQSDKDVQSYLDASGRIADPTYTTQERKAAAREIVRIMTKRKGQFTLKDLPVSSFTQPQVSDAPEGVDPALWGAMTPDERALWQK